jgi:hypothetical protein
MDWTESEEKIISRITKEETMHDPNCNGDKRIQCSRIEAVRRFQRRKVSGVYREPSKPWVLADIHLPASPSVVLTPERIAALNAGRTHRALMF